MHSLASLLACEKSFSVWWLSIICRSHFFLQKLTRRDAPYLAELIIRQERLTKLAVCRAVGTRGKEGGTIATPLKILANMLTLSHSGGRGGHHITTIPTLGCSGLPTALVCALLGQAKLFDSMYITISLGWLWRKKNQNCLQVAIKTQKKRVKSYLFFINFKFTDIYRNLNRHILWKKLYQYFYWAGAPVAFKTWWGLVYVVCVIYPTP